MPFFVEAGFNLNLISRIGSVWLPIMRHSQSKGILPSEDNSWWSCGLNWSAQHLLAVYRIQYVEG
jgi:hypothetical protein